MCKCGARWGGLKAAHCGTCHLTFSTVGNFDRHRAGAVERRRCVDPATVGLAPNAQGVYRTPSGPGVTWGTPDA